MKKIGRLLDKIVSWSFDHSDFTKTAVALYHILGALFAVYFYDITLGVIAFIYTLFAVWAGELIYAIGTLVPGKVETMELKEHPGYQYVYDEAMKRLAFYEWARANHSRVKIGGMDGKSGIIEYPWAVLEREYVRVNK